MSEYLLKWLCGRCESRYNTEDAARECCQPVPYLQYICLRCDACFDTEDAARECCTWHEHEIDPIEN